jgi:hypothetical protein
MKSLTRLLSDIMVILLAIGAPANIQAQTTAPPTPLAYAILSLFALPTALIIFLMLFFILKAFEQWNKKLLWPVVVASIFLGYIIAFVIMVP